MTRRVFYGLHVNAPDANAVGGLSGVGFGIEGRSASGTGVYGVCVSGDGVVGESTSRNGVGGSSDSGTGVIGASFQGTGVEGISFAVSQPTIAVRGHSANGVGVWGESTNFGVFGICFDQPNGVPTTGSGVFGSAPRFSDFGNRGPFAARFRGDVKIEHGRLFVGSTIVAHHLVKVPMTLAAGLVELDRSGEAIVELPKGLENLHTNFRYQLTAVGGPAPNLHIAEEVHGHRFKIGGGTGKLKVSWQVSGEPKEEKPAAAERVSEMPFDETLAQEHGRWSENFARRLEEIKTRMQHLIKS